MKRFVLIAVFLSLAILGCDDGENLYDNEVVVNKDCTGGTKLTGIEFDSDSVRCGLKGNIYFGLDEIYDTMPFSPLGFYLFHDSSVRYSLDSVWILETDSAKIATCEKKKLPNIGLSGTFCLHKFDGGDGRDTVNYAGSFMKRSWNTYFIYSKYDFYKTLCNVIAYDCILLYSCVVQYNGTYNFSKVPDADDAEQKQIGCAD
jgi:hypothetical protein